MNTLDGQLRKAGFDLLEPCWYVVSLEDFEELKTENDDSAAGFSYEEFCELEREAWNDMVRQALNKEFEGVECVPKQMFWGQGVRRIRENPVSQLVSSGSDIA